MLSARGRPEDGAHQPDGEDQFPHHGGGGGDAVARKRQTRRAMLADQRPQEHRGQNGSHQLCDDVEGNALPGKVAP